MENTNIYSNFTICYRPPAKCQRSALVKFGCGVAPLKIETGRYTSTSEKERQCTLCKLQEVESEEYCLIRCELYLDIRQTLFHTVFLINANFDDFNNSDNLFVILSTEQIIPNYYYYYLFSTMY